MLKTLRQQKKYSLRKLAALSGVAKSTIHSIEAAQDRGDDPPMTLGTLTGLAMAFQQPRHETLRQIDAR